MSLLAFSLLRSPKIEPNVQKPPLVFSAEMRAAATHGGLFAGTTHNSDLPDFNAFAKESLSKICYKMFNQTK